MLERMAHMNMNYYIFLSQVQGNHIHNFYISLFFLFILIFGLVFFFVRKMITKKSILRLVYSANLVSKLNNMFLYMTVFQ